jgi:uncharacterized protein (TIGR00255 family)
MPLRGLKSMTGFGTASVPLSEGRVSVEVRTVNQRFLDVRVNAPREYAAWEATCREIVRRHVARGRVEVHVSRNAPASARARVVLNLAAARDYAAAWRRLRHAVGLRGDLDPMVFRTPEIFQTVELPGDARGEFPAASRAVEQALRRLDRERRREGANLQRDMRARVRRLVEIERAIRGQTANALDVLQARVTERMQTLLKGAPVDPGRIAQEAAYLAERGDVTEERVRLLSHLTALGRLLASHGAVGKQFEFLLQEVHREINTIGSKVNDLAVTRLVVEAKGEVERLREQVQNVE